eukprot:TRINITY_DN765_c0_g1_i2.p1 TRINITY_DN765_c0_g1~~TRINITY_DN765_c0_g1_i2.p1  ORF type:complete len:441 (+),score=40.04 TRINITY_DN765_c0_g1_i2:157-1479(+)
MGCLSSLVSGLLCLRPWHVRGILPAIVLFLVLLVSVSRDLHGVPSGLLQQVGFAALDSKMRHSSFPWNLSGTQADPVLRLYELYYSEAAHPFLHTTPPYLPLSVHPSAVRPNSADVDAPKILPVLQDKIYQKLLCEYGAIFALDSHLDAVHGSVPWVAFQSWRAKEKNMAISDSALQSLQENLRGRIPGMADGNQTGDTLTLGVNDFIFWGTWVNHDLYGQCDSTHTWDGVEHCSPTYALIFETIFTTVHSTEVFPKPGTAALAEEARAAKADRKHLPPMPWSPMGWADCSYFALHISTFPSLVRLARMFFVVLEAIYDLHGDTKGCPLKFNVPQYDDTLCWCFFMERLVNVWAYHSGRRMIFVEHETGVLTELHPVSERQMWSHWFEDSHLEQVYSAFPRRLAKPSLTLFEALGGQCTKEEEKRVLQRASRRLKRTLKG